MAKERRRRTSKRKMFRRIFGSKEEPQQTALTDVGPSSPLIMLG
jgi:hypothetical protein